MMFRFIIVALIWFSIAAFLTFTAVTETLNTWYHDTAKEWSAR